LNWRGSEKRLAQRKLKYCPDTFPKGLRKNKKHIIQTYIKVKVKFTLEQVTKAQRGSRGIALLFP
jgi:hypothetical protein